MSKMSKQLANPANAQKSTGPITAAGKARSAMNSRTHGLCAKEVVVGPEEQADYHSLLEAYLLELDPDGPVEQTLFSEIVAAAWQLGRVQRMETEACSGKSSYAEILDDEVLQKKLDRLARHHTRIERTFHRCLKQLKAIQKERIDNQEIYVTLRRRDPISERTQSDSRRPHTPATTTFLHPKISPKSTVTAMAGQYESPLNESAEPPDSRRSRKCYKVYAMKKAFYGWWITAAAVVTFGLSTGLPYYNMPFFYDYFQRAFGWPLPQITFGFPLAAILTFGGPVLVPRFSPRKLIVLGTFCTFLALLRLRPHDGQHLRLIISCGSFTRSAIFCPGPSRTRSSSRTGSKRIAA